MELSAEQYQGLMRFVLGLSFYLGLFFTLKIGGLKTQQKNLQKKESDLWQGFEDLILTEIYSETPLIKSFVFKRVENRIFPVFQAGQFLSFQIENNEKEIRSYSISSSPQQRGSVQVSIKLITGGKGSEWFHSLQVGDRVKATPPSGRFVDETFDSLGANEDRVYLAGGIGITPILSMIQNRIENSQFSQRMTLFYGVRKKSDLVFHDLLMYWSKRHPYFSYYWFLSEDEENSENKEKLDFASIKKYLKDLTGKIYYLCGPEPMMEALVEGLLSFGLDESHLRMEKFVSPSLLDPEKFPLRNLQIRKGNQVWNYQGRENILSFLESQGETVAYSCRSGVCGTCKIRLKGKGKVKNLTDSGLSLHEKKEGWILSCVSYPEEDIEIDY